MIGTFDDEFLAEVSFAGADDCCQSTGKDHISELRHPRRIKMFRRPSTKDRIMDYFSDMVPGRRRQSRVKRFVSNVIPTRKRRVSRRFAELMPGKKSKLQTRISNIIPGKRRQQRQARIRWGLISLMVLLPLGVAVWYLIRQETEALATFEEEDEENRRRNEFMKRQQQGDGGNQAYRRTEMYEQASLVKEQDNLVEIEGIGPKTAEVLREAGITTFRQLAELEDERLKEIVRNADLRLADTGTWKEQARLAANGEWEGLYTMREKLRGGRRIEE